MLKTKKLYMQMCHQAKDLRRITPDELKALQVHLLKMYKDIEAVCDRHGLTIMLAFGSVLGAVRHGGFIPWDDDLDVLMPRDDYDKFINLYADELPDNYITYAPDSKNGPIYRICKVVDSSTRLVPAGVEETGEPSQGVFIDVFPLEYITDNKWVNRYKKAVCMFLMYTASSVDQFKANSRSYRKLMSGSPSARFNYWFRMIWGFCFSFLKTSTWYNLCDRFCRSTKKTRFVDYVSANYRWKPKPLEMFLPVSKADFEDTSVYLPNQPVQFLEEVFGDWQRIPPESERWEHFVKKLELNQH